jgi:hypothetical protein
MRARDIMLYIICVNVAAPIVLNMGIYVGGPAGTSTDTLVYTTISIAIGLLAAGGVSVFAYNFKIPAILTVYSAMYVGSGTMLGVLILQIVPQIEIAAGINVMLGILLGVIGVFGAMEISGGPHGPMA